MGKSDGDVFREPGTPLTEDQKLCRKLTAEQVAAEPGSFFMGDWDTDAAWFGGNRVERTFATTCGTTRCLAGWALFHAGCPVRVGDTVSSIEDRAIAALGLTHDEYFFMPGEDGYSELFYASRGDAAERIAWLAAES